jgi:hypothetical protein
LADEIRSILKSNLQFESVWNAQAMSPFAFEVAFAIGEELSKPLPFKRRGSLEDILP